MTTLDKRQANSEIHSIRIEYSDHAMTYGLGQKHVRKTLTITEIIVDENYQILHGVMRYLVVVEKESGEQLVWKSFHGLPVTVTYKV